MCLSAKKIRLRIRKDTLADSQMEKFVKDELLQIEEKLKEPARISRTT